MRSLTNHKSGIPRDVHGRARLAHDMGSVTTDHGSTMVELIATKGAISNVDFTGECVWLRTITL